MDADVVLLSRIQFGLAAAVHIVFPSLTVGMAWFLAGFYGRWVVTGRRVWLDLYLYWQPIFALAFGVGVVSGLVMSFQFGLNWARFSTATGPVIGPLIGLEVATAFFLEAAFFGIMMFGRGRVSERVYLFSVFMVALGALISSTWIMSANSWMHSPAGTRMVTGPEGQVAFEVTDWWAVVFNPSVFWRMPHMILGAFATGAFLLGGVHAWHLLRGDRGEVARRGFGFATLAALVILPAQIWVGDGLGAFMAQNQTAKVAAWEGSWEATSPSPYNIVVIPDLEGERNRFALSIPVLGSILDTHSLSGEIPGLKDTPPDERPNMWWLFYGFRVMFAIGIAMLMAALAALLARAQGRLFTSRPLLRFWAVLTPMGPVAVIAGWIVSEVGRQPWVVYGQMRTATAASPLTGGAALTGLLSFAAVYSILLTAYLVFAVRMMRRHPSDPPPRAEETLPEDGRGGAPAPGRTSARTAGRAAGGAAGVPGE